jgi:hypothetical protein
MNGYDIISRKTLNIKTSPSYTDFTDTHRHARKHTNKILLKPSE